jgi:carbon-monoxide dehydrogenase small subunit
MRELEVELVVNGRSVRERTPPRMHLADLLREKLRLTGTHLRCEQGVCGACTILIDGEPIRSCITYAALCSGSNITTIEGLDTDPIAVQLREAFSREHGLQCGFCTPGMLVTARDIVLRLPGADESRIRLELSGNLCRCTGYAGIVRAIKSVLDAKDSSSVARVQRLRLLAPIGSKIATVPDDRALTTTEVQKPQTIGQTGSPMVFGLGGRKPNIQMSQAFVVGKHIDEVWLAFEDVPAVAACLPGAHLNSGLVDDIVEGSFSAKLGPITASFSGNAKITRDKETYSGLILGGGQDPRAGSRASGEVNYKLIPDGEDRTRVELEIRALIAGPLAQFGRSGIVDDLAKRIIQAFSENLERKLSGASLDQMRTSLNAGSLVADVIIGRLKRLAAPIFRVLRNRKNSA